VSLKKYVPATVVEAMAKSLHATVVLVRLPRGQQELQFVRTTITARSPIVRRRSGRDLTGEIAQLQAQCQRRRARSARVSKRSSPNAKASSLG